MCVTPSRVLTPRSAYHHAWSLEKLVLECPEQSPFRTSHVSPLTDVPPLLPHPRFHRWEGFPLPSPDGRRLPALFPAACPADRGGQGQPCTVQFSDVSTSVATLLKFAFWIHLAPRMRAVSSSLLLGHLQGQLSHPVSG